MNINEELKQLRILTIENNSVNISKEDLSIEIERIKVKNEMLKEENNQYRKQIEKVKKAKKMFSLYTSLYYLFTILLLIINFATGLFLNHLLYTIASFTGLTLIYLYAISDEAKTLSRNDIRFYKKLIKENNKDFNKNDEMIKMLDKDLRNLIKRSYDLRKKIEQTCENLSCSNSVDLNKEQNIDNYKNPLTKKL